ncbi:hypothetical protein [Streptomyces sp. NPDC005784]|uniref:hypothetical protein n=1 Tax=Streptomyces sp. NPDC005784 TaxID=3364731 RepID=UPI0036C33FDB
MTTPHEQELAGHILPGRRVSTPAGARAKEHERARQAAAADDSARTLGAGKSASAFTGPYARLYVSSQ